MHILFGIYDRVKIHNVAGFSEKTGIITNIRIIGNRDRISYYVLYEVTVDEPAILPQKPWSSRKRVRSTTTKGVRQSNLSLIEKARKRIG